MAVLLFQDHFVRGGLRTLDTITYGLRDSDSAPNPLFGKTPVCDLWPILCQQYCEFLSRDISLLLSKEKWASQFYR